MSKHETTFTKSIENRVLQEKPYPHYDVDKTWNFIKDALKTAAKMHDINRICVSSHGAAAALINPANTATGLALPILDYEWDGVNQYDVEYNQLRPEFNESYSPNLPFGLNLGRQLFWQSKEFPKQFNAAKHIVPLAQYWTWRLCGVIAGEISGLGCHTDLWAPHKKGYSLLVKSQNWQNKFPALRPAWDTLGHLSASLARKTGINKKCQVLTGAHDSNASLARFLNLKNNDFGALVSTGTWTITLNINGSLDDLNENRDMLANIDIAGNPVCCARFMGGREYEEICTRFDAKPDNKFTLENIQKIINDEVYALPDFSHGSGPCGGREPAILGSPDSPPALAALYCALMIDLELDLLRAHDNVIIEGSFLKNDFICDLVASFRPTQKIDALLSIDGVAQGCLSLAKWNNNKSSTPKLSKCQNLELPNLGVYRNTWRKLCESEKDL